MNSFTTFQRILFMLTTTLFMIPYATSLDCSPSSGNIKCECTATIAECFGTQVDLFEAEEILKNLSRIENVIFKINDLQFDSTFMLENSDIKNLTLGYTKYGLQVLSSNFFSRLSSSIISLNLQNNSIIKIDDYFFSNFSVLTELFIDNNDIENLTSNAFSNLNNLKYLSLSYNNISDITPEVFQYSISLETMILSHNKFSLIENISIKSATLTELKIDNCLIEGIIHKNTLENIPNTEMLDISYNKLSGIGSHSLSALKKLKYLNLSYNVIEYLEENAFSNIGNITTLDLQGNIISVIKLSSFEKLQNLIYLDLSGNKLKAVLCEYTTDFTSLEKIYLQNNNIKTFTPGAFHYSPKLKIMDMTGNNLECSCPLTESALYLIENGTMERADFDSVSCIISSTGSQLSIIKYESSKCVPVEPCKRVEVTDEEDYEYDYENPSLTSTIDTIFTTTADTTTASTTDTTTPLTIATTSPSPVDTSTVSRTTTTIVPAADTTIALTADTTTAPTDDTTTAPTDDTTTASTVDTTTTSTADTTTTSTADTTTTSTADTTTTSIISITGASTIPTLHTENVSSEESTILIQTMQSISSENETDSTTKPLITITEYNAINTTTINTDSEDTIISFTKTTTDNNASNTMTISTNSEITTGTFPETTTEIYIERASDSGSKELNTTLSVLSEVTTATTSTVSTTERLSVSSTTVTRKIMIPETESGCSSLQLSVGNVSLSSDFTNLTIYKNFTNRNDIFCLKWTASGIKGLKIRCSLKYTTTAETKVLNLKCPSSPYEIKDWTINEKVFKFCIILYPVGKRKQDSCALLVSEKSTSPTSKQPTTSTTATTITTTTNTMTTITPTESITESVTLLVDTTTDITSTLHGKITTVFDKTTTDTTLTSDKINTDTTSATNFYSTDFEIIALNLYFNDSKLAFTTWTVNKNQPLSVCNMTLKVSTQYFDEIESVFPCKNNTYRLKKVKEDDTFKVCLFSYHVISGEDNLCQHTLPSAKAAMSKDDSLNSSLIPLICLLILVGIIILFVVLKNLSKRRSVSKKYDVRAEEERYQERTKLRPQSVHEESVRFSYIAKENHEFI